MMKLEEILNKNDLTKDEIVFLLGLDDPAEVQMLFKRADEIRYEYCGNEVHFRGVIEFSNYCEQDCLYCGIRSSNEDLQRYRMTADEIIQTAKQIIKQGIGTIVLQSGEDEYYDTDMISYIIYSIKQLSDVAITLCLGERNFDEYKSWKIAGADRYLLKHETANPRLYSIIHSGQNLHDRIDHLKYLKSIGFQVGSGNMIGLPTQTSADIADDILLAKNLEIDMAAFGPFVPSPSTPYQHKKPGDVLITLKTIAVLRLVLKNAHIPSTTALDTIDEAGREKGLSCGANVVMPNFTPNPYRNCYQIYPTERRISPDPEESANTLRKRIEAIGRKVSDKRGDSLRLTV